MFKKQGANSVVARPHDPLHLLGIVVSALGASPKSAPDLGSMGHAFA